MSEKIKRSDIFEGDPFKDLKETLEKSLITMKKYDEHLKALETSYKAVAESVKTSTYDLTKLIDEFYTLIQLYERANKKV